MKKLPLDPIMNPFGCLCEDDNGDVFCDKSYPLSDSESVNSEFAAESEKASTAVEPQKKLIRFMVAKEVLMSDGTRYFESSGSIWTDLDRNVVQNNQAWSGVRSFDRSEHIPDRWHLERELQCIWKEGILGSHWSDQEAGKCQPLHQLPLCSELLELLTSLHENAVH